MRSRRVAWQYVLGGVLVAALAPSSVRAAQIVFVDDLGDCEGNTPCFTTIQQGVNNVSAPPSDQAQVRVYPGTYNESVNLFLIGSAVSGQVDVLIVNTGFFDFFGGPATSPALGESGPALGISPQVVEQFQAARQRWQGASVDASSGATAEGGAAGVPLMPVNINSPTGPAIYGSNLAVEVVMVGLTVHSPDADGVDIISTGGLEFNLGHADGNAGDGVQLESTASVAASGSTFNDNGGNGAWLTSTESSVSISNSIADANTLNGFLVSAISSVTVFSFPLGTDPLFMVFPQQVAARRNGQNGISAASAEEAVTVVDLQAILGLVFAPTIILDDNTLSGLLASASEGVTAGGVQANRNDLDGLSLTTDLGVTLFSVSVHDNQAQGVFVPSADYLLAIAVLATGNRNGIAATTSASTEASEVFPAFGALLIGTTTDDNMLNGTLVTATGGPILIYAPTAISNGVVGIQTQSPAASQSQITGGIICENTIGLAQETNALVNAEGNWWGSLSGPFHTAKNPGGAGNEVADGTSGGGMGDVDFIPWIDTVSGSAPSGALLLTPSPIRFQFSGGNGTVFLGAPSTPFTFGEQVLGPGARPIFTVTTDNGVVVSGTQMSASVMTSLTAPQGIAEVSLIPFALGPVTVTITGPCGLTGTFTFNVQPARTAPLLSGIGLLAAFAVLLVVAAISLRRSDARL